MKSSADTMHSEKAAPRDWQRPLRYLVRIPLLSLHVLFALPLALLVINPVAPRLNIAGERLDHRVIRWWSGTLVRLFGFRIRRYGQPLSVATMFVANHVSWLDIELLHSQRMMCFIAKAEIARWPLVGWLASRASTIYHRRGNTQSLDSVMQAAIDRLQQGLAIGVFPEGGTGPGTHLRTFHARIFQVAVEANVPVQPVALRYARKGELHTSIAFATGESFFANFFRVLGEPGLDAEVHFLSPIESQGNGRRVMADSARQAIGYALGFAEKNDG